MALGGSGDRLAFALSRQAEELGDETGIFRMTPFNLQAKRGDRKKDEDAALLSELLLVEIAAGEPTLFQETTRRDRDLIRLREAWRARVEAMKSRIACEQRLLQHLNGQIFCTEEGKFPEGSIEAIYDKAKANDVIFTALGDEEEKRNKEVTKVLNGLDVFHDLFDDVDGIGPMLAARIIVAIGDIRRFSAKAKLRAFCGVHTVDGQFARKRSGAVANWHNDARQALYLAGDQFNRRPDSEWGKHLRYWKKVLRERHPVVECSYCKIPWDQCVDHDKKVYADGGEGGKKKLLGTHNKRYTDAHIHKMGLWRTLTKFVNWLYGAWWWIEGGKQGPKPRYTPGPTPPSTKLEVIVTPPSGETKLELVVDNTTESSNPADALAG